MEPFKINLFHERLLLLKYKKIKHEHYDEDQEHLYLIEVVFWKQQQGAGLLRFPLHLFPCFSILIYIWRLRTLFITLLLTISSSWQVC